MDRLGDHPSRSLQVSCTCGRAAVLPIRLLARQYNPATYLGAVCQRLRCSVCGYRPSSIRLVERGDEGASGMGKASIDGSAK